MPGISKIEEEHYGIEWRKKEVEPKISYLS